MLCNISQNVMPALLRADDAGYEFEAQHEARCEDFEYALKCGDAESIELVCEYANVPYAEDLVREVATLWATLPANQAQAAIGALVVQKLQAGLSKLENKWAEECF